MLKEGERMIKKNLLILLAGLVLVGLIAAGFYIIKIKKNNSTGPDLAYQEPNPGFVDASAVPADAVTVKITDQGFVPQEITIKQGEKITWINLTKDYVWPASDPHPTHTNYPEFDPQLPMKPNQAWSFAFVKTGNWGYHNHLFPSERGTVHVTE